MMVCILAYRYYTLVIRAISLIFIAMYMYLCPIMIPMIIIISRTHSSGVFDWDTIKRQQEASGSAAPIPTAIDLQAGRHLCLLVVSHI